MKFGPSSGAKKLLGFLIISSCSALCAAGLLYTGILQRQENATWDLRMRAMADPAQADSRIKIITVDQPSLDYFADDGLFWPLPRPLYGRVVDFLRKAGARATAFDVLFSEESCVRVSEDEELARSFDGPMPVVVPVVLSNSKHAQSLERYDALRKRQAAALEHDPFDHDYLRFSHIPQFISVTPPVPQLLDHASGFGNVFAPPDSDGIFRHYFPGGYVRETPVLSLPFALYETARSPGAPRLDLGPYMDRDGRLTVRFYGPERTYPTYSMASVVQSMQSIEDRKAPAVDPAAFKDAWVFIGFTAPGLRDLRPTPLSELYAGVEYNATVLDNLLHGAFVRNTPLVTVTVLAVTLAALVSAMVILLPSRGMLLVAFVFLGYGYGAFYLAARGWWLPMVAPLSGMLLSAVLSLAFQYWLEGRQHRFIRHAFRHYVSEGVVDKIIADPTSLSLGGERRELTIFFSDIAGFTSISERIEASRLATLLNRFLTAMTDIILETGGTVDKYVGDAIVAFWNAPLAVPDHAERAVRAALICQERIIELRDSFEREFGASIAMRIGINTGLVSVGNFGSRERFNYTVIGDAANLASRLEGANKQFGTLVLASASTLESAQKTIAARKVADILVVGRTQAVTIYEPLAAEESRDHGRLARFDAARILFEERKLEEALRAFRELRDDPVARAYAARIESDLLHFGNGWKPVWNLTEK
jgi:adenylate cyclase